MKRKQDNNEYITVVEPSSPFLSSLWDLLPIETVTDHIVGHDLEVYGKLLCVDKGLQNWIYSQRPSFYHDMFKANYPNEYCLFHHLIDTERMALIREMIWSNAYTTELESLFAYNPEDGRNHIVKRDPYNDGGTVQDITTLLGSTLATTFLQYHPKHKALPKWYFTLRDKQVIFKARSDVDFAVKAACLFNLCHPFAIAPGSFYMASQHILRDTLLAMVRICIITPLIWKNIDPGSPFALFVGSLINRKALNEMAVNEWLESSPINELSSIERVVSFNLDLKKYAPVTMEFLLEMWKTHIEPHLTPSIVGMLDFTTNKPDEKRRHIDTIDPIMYTRNLTSYIQKQRKSEAWYLKELVVGIQRAVTKFVYCVEDENDPHRHELLHSLMLIEKQISGKLLDSIHATKFTWISEKADSEVFSKNLFLTFQPLLYRAVNKIFV